MVEVRRAGAADMEAVRELALKYPFAEYRCYRLSKHDFASDYLALQAQRFMESDEPIAFLAESGGKPVGFAGAARADWDSSHFGLEMGGVKFLFARGSQTEQTEIHAKLLEALVRAVRDRGMVHLNAKIDVEDMAGLAAVQKQGFRVMDTLVTYINDATRTRPPEIQDPPGVTRTTYHKDRLHEVPYSEIEHIADFMRKGYRIDRYHADTRLPADRSHEVYVEWFKKAFEGKWADGVHVVRKDGKIVGFCSVQDQPELLELYDARITARGLAGVVPEGKGAYAIVTEMVRTNCPVGTRFQEFDTQIQNFPVINVWIKQGMPYMRGRYTLHRWLDE